MERIEPTEVDLRWIEGLSTNVDVISLVEELPAEQRRAVTARVVDEQAYGDIAEELDISLSGARKRVSRGLASLRGRLREGR